MLLLLSFLQPAQAEKINDVELGFKLEAPLIMNDNVQETSIGLGSGNSQIHVGYQAEFAYAITSHWYFTGAWGTRRQYLQWEHEWTEGEDLPDSAYMQTRDMRLLAGVKYSFLKAPTFLYFGAGGGYVSGYWDVALGTAKGDRVSRGGTAYGSFGVDHFLNPRMAVAGELKLFGETHSEELMAQDGWTFESPAVRYGTSLMVGVTFR